ncbi:unnamed protein product [Paramecium pentaurelia]|uniref:Uncharacterized protein n=1 Tax=Paramecium pentaurelia TaxID=43138 RepID=A0A8S1VUW2_9CILI|nr:unnamed protein product [Paramecium pentaurelia]
MKHTRDSVNPEVREFIKQFTSSQQELRLNKQTNTDQSTSTIVQSDIKSDHVKVKEVFFKLPQQENTENKQPYLKISKTPVASSFTNSLSSMDQDRYTEVIVQKVVEELERRNYCKKKPLLSIQQNTIQMSITPKSELEYLDDDSFIRQIQQTLLSPNQTPKKVQIRAFDCFDQRQKKYQVQKEQKLQKQKETQELTKLVDEFKSFLLRTRSSGKF